MTDENRTPFREIRSRSSVDYVLRSTMMRQIHLSMMADQKANILIGASFVVLTLIFGQSRGATLSAALICLGVTAMAAAFFAGLAVVPRVRKPKQQRSWRNPFFFATQAAMSDEAFDQELAAVLKEDEGIYATLARDIQDAGRVLDRKYRFVGLSYYCYFIGIPLSVLLFLVG